MEEPSIDWHDVFTRLERVILEMEAEPTLDHKATTQLLQLRAVQLARPLPEANPVEERFLIRFNIGGERYAVDGGQVQEIVPLRLLTPVPGIPAFIAGIMNLRGQLLTVVDLRSILGVQGEQETSEAKVLVVVASGRQFGILAEGNVDVQRMPAVALMAVADTVTENRGRFVRAVTEDFTQVLAIETLVSSGAIVVNDEGL